MRYYTPQEIADILHQSIWTIRDKILRGDFGDTLNTGKTHLVTQEGLDRYIKAHTGSASGRVVQVSFVRKKRLPKAAKL